MILNFITLKKIKEKIYKYTCTVKFDNKALELIQIPQIFYLPEVVFQLPDKLKNNNNNPPVAYQLGKIIRKKNYKYSVNTVQCHWSDSRLCDPHHKDILTGDLQIIKNNKLRNLLTKGPN